MEICYCIDQVGFLFNLIFPLFVRVISFELNFSVCVCTYMCRSVNVPSCVLGLCFSDCGVEKSSSMLMGVLYLSAISERSG